MKAIRMSALSLAALLAACANNLQDQPAFNQFTNKVQNECYYQNIGSYQVGSLLENATSNNAIYFLDQLQRVYQGNISTQQFVSGVTSFLNGRDSDPGIRCVVDRLPTARPNMQRY
jgi:hypothetical protein